MIDGEPETVVSASLQKIKLIKNPIQHFFIFYFIKSETSDSFSFVDHFDGHFAYLKTLDFYFNVVLLQLLVCLLYFLLLLLFSVCLRTPDEDHGSKAACVFNCSLCVVV